MKRYLLITLLVLLLFGLAASVQAVDTIVKSYPELRGAPEPTAGIPQYIRYIFVFSLGTVGIVAFIAMLIAAFQYVTAVGNPQKAADAKGRIESALLGMLLLFGSYLLLNTINPDLLKLKKAVVGVGVEIPVSPEEGQMVVCQPKEAYWDKKVVNVGESASLIFILNQLCPEDAILEVACQKKGFARQDRPVNLLGGPEAVAGWDPYCDIYRTGNYNRGTDKATGRILIKYIYTFANLTAIPTKGHCTDAAGISSCITQVRNEICNFYNDEPETIYVKEECWMIINGQQQKSKFFVPRLPITVKDLKDGVCCK